jgi:hypothetical protein
MVHPGYYWCNAAPVMLIGNAGYMAEAGETDENFPPSDIYFDRYYVYAA